MPSTTSSTSPISSWRKSLSPCTPSTLISSTAETIFVRSAKPGEEFAALNGESYTLDPSNLVIADAQGAIALAGVIGGAGSAISDSTTRIVLESANFNAASVRKTSSRLKLRTDASMRFEKAQDPVNTVRGLQRALELLEQVSPGIRLVGGLADAYRPLPAQPPVLLPIDWLDRKLGRARFPRAKSARFSKPWNSRWRKSTRECSLSSCRAGAPPRTFPSRTIWWRKSAAWWATIPSLRLRRWRLPESRPRARSAQFHHRVREMAAAQGFTEVYNYSFLSDDQAPASSASTRALPLVVQVANPIAAGHNLLRPSLLPLIWKNIGDNARHFDQFRLFEIGREIHPDGEVPHFAAAIYAKDDGSAGLFELKRLAECLAPVAFRPSSSDTILRTSPSCGRCLVGETRGRPPVRISSKHGGSRAGRRARSRSRRCSKQLQPAPARYQPLRRFPASAFDLSVVAPARALVGDVQARLARHAGADLLSIVFLRDFALPDGQRSLSYRLTVGASDRTLSSEEVSAIRARIIDGMHEAGFDLKV